MNTKLLIIIVVIVVIVGGFYFFDSQGTSDVMNEEDVMKMKEAEVTSDPMSKRINDEERTEMESMVYRYSGELSDVTGGQDVRGINTGGGGSGIAQSNFKDGTYNLFVTFQNLPDPVGSDFYEGWIVRRGINFSVINTGRVEKVGGLYTNVYKSEENLNDHDFYVLTIEPDDGDPAPADHILEGTLEE